MKRAPKRQIKNKSFDIHKMNKEETGNVVEALENLTGMSLDNFAERIKSKESSVSYKAKFAKFFQDKRNEQNLSLKTAAAIAHINIAVIKKMETLTGNYNVDSLINYAQALGYDIVFVKKKVKKK